MSLESSPDVYKPKLDMDYWKKCPPATIYLIISILSIIVMIWKGTLGLVSTVLYLAVVLLIYYFFAFLCDAGGIARTLAWVLIVLQLLGIASQLFS